MDAVISCGTAIVNGHSLLLSTVCPFFLTLFKSHEENEGKKIKLIITPKTKHDDVETVTEFGLKKIIW